MERIQAITAAVANIVKTWVNGDEAAAASA